MSFGHVFAGNEPASWLYACLVLLCVPFSCFHFPFGVLNRMWKLIVWIPDQFFLLYIIVDSRYLKVEVHPKLLISRSKFSVTRKFTLTYQ